MEVHFIYTTFRSLLSKRRCTGLMRAGVLRWDERPLWYDIYVMHPPREEPRVDRDAVVKDAPPVRRIFFPEDKLRAHFYEHFVVTNTINMLDEGGDGSLSERFIEIYESLPSELGTSNDPKQKYWEKVQRALALVREECMQIEGDKKEAKLLTADDFKVAAKQERREREKHIQTRRLQSRGAGGRGNREQAKKAIEDIGL